jgi:hypothetical protein
VPQRPAPATLVDDGDVVVETDVAVVLVVVDVPAPMSVVLVDTGTTVVVVVGAVLVVLELFGLTSGIAIGLLDPG